MSHAVVIVLGDIGRSPRMMMHAISMSEEPSVRRVTLIGYEGSTPIHMGKKVNMVYISEANSYANFGVLKLFLKGITLLCSLIKIFIYLPYYDVVMIQNPPCIPVIFALLIVSVWQPCATIIIDWHNLGFTMFRSKIYSRISYFFERILSKFCHRHICVSHYMRNWLAEKFNIDAIVLHDRPSDRFARNGTMLADRHSILLKLGYVDQDLFKNSNINFSSLEILDLRERIGTSLTRDGCVEFTTQTFSVIENGSQQVYLRPKRYFVFLKH